MPVTPTYPGVYIEEIPGGVRTITGVATSVAAFVDFFTRGPMNKAVQIFSMADLEREFGKLDERSEASYAIQQFFLNGGTEAWVVRVASADVDPVDPNTLIPPTAASVVVQGLTIKAANEGAWGNRLRVGVDYDTSDPAALFNMTVSEVDEVQGRTVVVRQERFRNLSMIATAPSFVQSIVNAGSKLITVEALGPALPTASGTMSGELGSPISILAGKIAVTFAGALPADADLGVGTITSLNDAANRLTAGIRGAKPGNLAWAQTTVHVVANTNQLQIVAGPSAPDAVISFANARSDTTATDLQLTSPPATLNVAQYQLGSQTSGTDGIPPDATALIGSPASDPPTGLFALDKVSLFNILCLPRIAKVSETANAFDPAQVDTVISTARNYCEQRRAFFIVDTPSDIDTVPKIKDWMTDKDTLRHKNLAINFPRILTADPLSNFQLRSFGASGTMAGIYARTDAARGVWKAPAGIEAVLRNVQQLSYKLNDPENGTLNSLGINCLRNFPVYGNVAWGARTLDGADQQASEWKYIPVRRLALFLEESLYRGTQWVVFEPNDEPLWAQIRLNIGAFMHNLFRHGAFQGQTPKEAYFVKCDKETTTQNDINLGIVNIVVGFAPLKPAEFVIIKIQQIAGQIQT